MGIFDKAKKLAKENKSTINTVVDKVGDAVDKKTSGKHTSKVDKAQQFVRKQTDKL